MGLTDPTLERVLAHGARTGQACYAAALTAPQPSELPSLLQVLRMAHTLAVQAQAQLTTPDDSARLHVQALAVGRCAGGLLAMFRAGGLQSESHFDLLWAADLARDVEQFGPRHVMEPALVRRIARKAQTLQAGIEASHLWPAVARVC